MPLKARSEVFWTIPSFKPYGKASLQVKAFQKVEILEIFLCITVKAR